MFTKVIKSDTAPNTVIGVIDCNKTRRAAFQLLTTGSGTAKVLVNGSIDQKTWVNFGVMEVGGKHGLVDGGNAEFIWPWVQIQVENITNADATVTVITRI